MQPLGTEMVFDSQWPSLGFLINTSIGSINWMHLTSDLSGQEICGITSGSRLELIVWPTTPAQGWSVSKRNTLAAWAWLDFALHTDLWWWGVLQKNTLPKIG
jgi:hypothetical protein